MHLSRRRFLALSATFTVAACSSGDDPAPGTADAPTDSPPGTDSTTTTSTTTPPTTAAATTPAPTTSTTDAPLVDLDADPFAFGVGSGDPDERSVALWTRLAGPLPSDGIDVAWTFEPDDGSPPVGGTVVTGADVGGSVHVLAEVSGPGSYRFEAGGWESPTGRTGPIDPDAESFRFATASCQHYETGFYAAHRDIAEWSPDLVVFLGDFIYEGDPGELGGITVRRHEGPEPMDLDGYRRRYATYLGDEHLQASRAAAPWLVIWDDHEVENNYAGLISEDDAPVAEFAERRAMAYRAWWENTPTRLPPPELDDDPTAPYVIHRGLDVGQLLQISALDGRQFRDDQLGNVTLDAGPPLAGWDDPSRSMLGAEQEAWLLERWAGSAATWNCLAQQTVFGDVRLGDVGAILNYDQWDGYIAARDRLLLQPPPNLVTVTGDIHLAGVGEIGPADARLGVEFVTTAISSGANVDPLLEPVLQALPNIYAAELEYRGYTRHTVTPAQWTAEYRQVVDIADASSELQTWRTFAVDAGTPAVRDA